MFTEQYTRKNFLQVVSYGAAATAAAATVGAMTATAGADEAAGETDWLGPEPEIADIAETLECDVVVCGFGGTAGSFAACSAAENGAKVIDIDVAVEGCGSGVRDDLGVINSKLQQREGAPMDLDLLAQTFQRTGAWYHSDQLFNVWANESGATFDWYEERLNEAGLSTLHRLVNPPADESPSFSTCCGIDWGDYQLDQLSSDHNGIQVLIPYAEGLGVDIQWETKLVKCVKEGDRVTGVVAQRADGAYVQIDAAKGVILCTGGYMGNETMMRALQPYTVDMISFNSIWPNTLGDGIKAGLWAGAKLDPLHFSSTWEQGLVAPDEVVRGQYNDRYDNAWLGPLPFLRVNLKGERFMNEAGTYGIGGHELMYQAESDNTFVQVYDSSWEEDCEQFNYYSAERYFPYDNGASPLFGIDVVKGYVDEQVAEGLIVQADTIAELAEKIGVPADTLCATVERYNELVASGHDDDFHKPAYRMSAVDQPPYFACRIGEQGSHTMDGLLIDNDMRVLGEDMKPIAGLFAAGDCSGGFIGCAYLGNAAGNAAGRSITFGRHAGRVAALGE